MASTIRLVFLIVAGSVIASYGQVQSINMQVKTTSWNEYSQKWDKSVLTTWIDGKTAFIGASEGSNQSQVRLVEGSGDREKVIGFLKKSLEWAEKSKTEKLTTDKTVGMLDTGFKVVFISEDAGAKVGVVLRIRNLSSSNQFGAFFIEPPQIEQLIGILERLPAVIASAQADAKKADAVLK